MPEWALETATLGWSRPLSLESCDGKTVDAEKTFECALSVPALPSDHSKTGNLPKERKTGTSGRTRIEASVTKGQEAELNVDDQADRDQLLVWLAWAVYGGKSAGAPRKWTPKKQRLLLTDVRALQTANRGLSETVCCDRLSEGKGADGRYKGIKSRTLRRVLQNAKRLDRKAKVLATPLQEVIGSGSIGSTGSRETN
jgi:hypothetical protein